MADKILLTGRGEDGLPKTVEVVVDNGAVITSDIQLAFGPIYNDGTYKYFGEAQPGTALTAAAWRVFRMNILTGRIEWADGDTNFDNVFTDLATVAALSYSL